MKRATIALSAFAFVAFVAFVSPALNGRHVAAVAATPTPAALQYDQIDRMVVNPATPPPPGSFAADYQTIVASQSGGGGQQHHGISSVIAQAMGAPDAAEDAANQMMAMVRQGHLTRYAFYKGWIRTDDPLAQTATISKCDRHQYITLDLAKKTYTLTDTQPPCHTPAMPMGGGMHGQSGHNEPGTVDMTVTNSAQNLGPLTIDGIGTNGSNASMQMTMANATGSCRNGQFGMGLMTYVSQIREPRAYCPLPRSTMPSNPTEMASQGGCIPTMHAQSTGMAGIMSTGDRLVMYRRMSMQSYSQGMFVMQRGNVKWFSGAPADALFEIPAGFTQGS